MDNNKKYQIIQNERTTQCKILYTILLILKPLFETSVNGSKEMGQQHVAVTSASLLSCLSADHSNLSQAMTITKCGYLLLCLWNNTLCVI
jgi:hypothetical protein